MTASQTPLALRELAQQWRDGGKGVMPLLIEQAADELDAARAEIAERQNTIDAQGGQIAALQGALANRGAEIAKLRERVIEECAKGSGTVRRVYPRPRERMTVDLTISGRMK